MSKVVINFCAGCGVKLPAPLHRSDSDVCPNCNLDSTQPAHRIRGEFDPEEAEKFDNFLAPDDQESL